MFLIKTCKTNHKIKTYKQKLINKVYVFLTFNNITKEKNPGLPNNPIPMIINLIIIVNKNRS